MCNWNVQSYNVHMDRVHTHGELVHRRGEARLAGQRTTTAVAAGTNTKEVRAFSQMEEAHEIIMKTRGATMATVSISLLNAELVHLQGGWVHPNTKWIAQYFGNQVIVSVCFFKQKGQTSAGSRFFNKRVCNLWWLRRVFGFWTVDWTKVAKMLMRFFHNFW